MERRVKPRPGSVDRRRAVRLVPIQPLAVRLLQADRSLIQGNILDISENGLRLYLDVTVACGATLRIETAEELLFGEVCYCQPYEQGYHVGLILRERLSARPIPPAARRVPALG